MSENVISIVGTKLRNLPKPVQECLKLCSCLGSRFEETFLSEIQGALSNVDDDSGGEHNIVGDIPLCLDIASRAGLVEPLGCSNQHPGFKFAHDKIFESALHLFSDERDRARTHFEIGKLLWRRRFCGNDADTIMKLSDRELFLCTDQLNRGREFVVDKSLRIKLAELNWHAAQRAEAKSAFFPAVTLLEVGIEMLQPVCWKRHYDLALKLYSSLAEMASKVGQVDKQQSAVDEVLAHATSADDAIRVHLVSLEHKTSQLKHRELIEASLSVLKLFGESIPLNPGILYKNRVFSSNEAISASHD